MRAEQSFQRIAAALLALVCTAAPLRASQEVHLTLVDGWARAYTEQGIEWLTPSRPALTFEGGVYFEVGPGCALEVVDTGRSSTVLRGSTSAELRFDAHGNAEFLVRRFEDIEVHAMRGALDISLPRGQRARIAGAVVHFAGTPDGRVHFDHLLGAPIELDLGGPYTFDLGVGTRRFLPERLTQDPAPRRRAHFGHIPAVRRPRPTAHVVAQRPASFDPPGVHRRGYVAEKVRTTLLDAARDLNREIGRITSGESGSPR